jgi:hypothetical protein
MESSAHDAGGEYACLLLGTVESLLGTPDDELQRQDVIAFLRASHARYARDGRSYFALSVIGRDVAIFVGADSEPLEQFLSRTAHSAMICSMTDAVGGRGH